MKDGSSYEKYREASRGDLIKMRIMQREIRPRISVTTEEIGLFYQEHRNEYEGKLMVRLQMIFLPAPDGGDQEEEEEEEEEEKPEELDGFRLTLACGGGTAARPRAWTESQKASTKEDQRWVGGVGGVGREEEEEEEEVEKKRRKKKQSSSSSSNDRSMETNPSFSPAETPSGSTPIGSSRSGRRTSLGGRPWRSAMRASEREKSGVERGWQFFLFLFAPLERRDL